jgi:hypothetical protein
MERFTQLFGELLLFVYHCFDRIVRHFSPLSPHKICWRSGPEAAYPAGTVQIKI